MRKWFISLFWSRWKVTRTIWPYPEGWGVYKKNYLTGDTILLDAGQTLEKAKQIAKFENGKN